MLTETQILTLLDSANDGNSLSSFVCLGDAYSYLIDCRLNVFRGENDQWAIAVERLGFSEKGGLIELVINYYGNCLVNLWHVNDKAVNNYTVFPVEQNSFDEAVNGFSLKRGAEFWLVRDKKVKLSFSKSEYAKAGIAVEDQDESSIQDAARLAIIGHRDMFRATDAELNRCLPAGLNKILVLDEWYHRDFALLSSPKISDDHLKYTYDFNMNLSGVGGLDFETFSSLVRKQEHQTEKNNKKEWLKNRPGCYETWRLLAKVITTGDTKYYQPKLKPNTHWSNWPQSGSL